MLKYFLLFLLFTEVVSQAAINVVPNNSASANAESLDGTYNYVARGGLGRARSVIQTNGAIRCVWFGDSLVTGQLTLPMASYFVNTYGLAGIQGLGAPFNNISVVITNSSGASQTANDFTTWFAPYYTLPINESVGFYLTNSSSATALGVTGNIITCDYIAENGAGTFKIQTNAAPSGAWADFVTGINANNGGAKAGVALRYTNATASTMLVRAVSTAGTIKVIDVGVQTNLRRGVVLNMFAQGGLGIDQFVQVPTNITGPILASWAPDIVFSKWLDTSVTVAASLPSVNRFISNYLASSDWVFIGANPIISGGGTATPFAIQDVKTQNQLFYNNAIVNGYNYFGGYSIFGSTNYAISRGWITTVTDPHPTVAGDLFTGDLIANWINLYSADEKSYGNLYFVYPSSNYDLTNAWLQTYNSTYNTGIGIGYNTIWGDGSIFVRSPSFQIGFDNGVFAAAETFAVQGTSGYYGASTKYYNANEVYRFINTNGYPANWTIYTSIADGSCTNITTTQTSWIGAGVAPYNRPKISDFYILTPGRCIEGELEGLYFTGASPGTCAVSILFTNNPAGIVTVAKSGFTPPANIAGDFFRTKFKLQCRSGGASGTVFASGSIEFRNGSTWVPSSYFTNQLTTIDCTVQNSLDFVSTNGASTDSFIAKNCTFWCR